MVNNQSEFNKKYPKEEKELKKIEIRRNRNFQGQLVIEDYLELEKLSLRDVKSVDGIVLKNLVKLQECTIWNCGTKDLVIENCPQVKKLNVRSNSLIDLEFLKYLENLEELEIDHNIEIDSGIEHLPSNLREFSYENTKLVEFLKPYKEGWRICQKDIQELVMLINKIPRGLLKNVISLDNSIDFERKYQNLKKTIDSLLKEKTEEIEMLEQRTNEINSAEKEEQNSIITADLLEKISNLKKSAEELAPFKKVYRKIEQKEKELENLKDTYLEKAKEKYKKVLEKLLKKMAQPNDSDFDEVIKESKEYLLEKIAESSQKLDEICSLKETIIKLQKSFNRHEKQINQIFINGGYNINNIGSNFYDSSSGGTVDANQQGTENLIAQTLIPSKK